MRVMATTDAETSHLREVHILHIDKTVAVVNGRFLQDVIEILRLVRPSWNLSSLHTKIFTGGITNKLVGCWENDVDDVVLFRIYGLKTETFIDREMEKQCMQLLWPLKCGPQLYAVFNNGLCYHYLPGITLEYKHIMEKNIYSLICKQLVKMHQAKLPSNVCHEPCLFPKIWKFYSLISDNFVTSSEYKCRVKLPDKASMKKEIEELEAHLTSLKSPIVFCHNDALLRNIIYDERKQSVAFIDFEYAGCNYQAFDIGNHFNEFAGLDEVDYSLFPDEQYQKSWLRTYLEYWYEGVRKNPADVTQADVNLLYVDVNKFSLASHLMWGLWAIVQALYSNIDFDYLKYASIRLNEYFARKKEFLYMTIED